MSTHLAAISPSQGAPFIMQSRPTPKPGPNEILIAVKSIALNPADGLMRNLGLFITSYPTVIGFDFAGLVLEIGDDVPTGQAHEKNKGLTFQPGITRVAAFAASFWRGCDADYGAFQERVVVPWQHAVPLPDGLSWNHAATLPVAVQVPLCAWDALGIPRVAFPTSASATDDTFTGHGKTPRKKEQEKNEALLIWGASSSIGTMGVQSARLLTKKSDSSFAAVYATASPANQAYIRSLGADRVFDYQHPGAVDAIISAAKEDGLVIRRCFLAIGDLAACQAVLNAFLGEKQAKIASAPTIPTDAKVVSGVEVVFLIPSMKEGERLEQFRYWIGTWLRENLVNGVIKPSPEPRVVGRGLEVINDGLDLLAQGISCTKLVVEIDI